MNTIYIIKALLIGFFGAGGFYIFMAFVFMYFPMPIFLYIQTRVLTWARKKHKKSRVWVDGVWKTIRFLLVTAMLITWWGMFAGYSMCLHRALTLYLPDAGSFF